MSLPKQVQLQAEEAERLEKQLLGISEEQAPEAGTEAASEHVEGQPVVETDAPSQEPEAPASQPKPEEATWEARYRSLQGKFNAEVPRLQAELKDVTGRFNALMVKLEAQETAKTFQPEQLVTDKDVEAFGSDLIDVIDRKAREVAASMVGTKMVELEAENAKLRDQLGGVSERQVSNDRRTFFSDLERLVPDYEAMNVDPGFLDWLADVDPLSGMARQEYLNAAYGSLDVGRTATLFNTFKQLSAHTPQSRNSKTLERQVAPGTSKVSSAAPADTMSGRIWSQGEIERFYRDVSRGTYRGSEAEQARIEAEIDSAVAEGRIR